MIDINSCKKWAVLRRADGLFVLFLLAAWLASHAAAQTFSVLDNFNPQIGSGPNASLTQGPDGTLYGTTSGGGAQGSGAIFKVRPDGTGFTNLYSFTALVNGTNGDGANPYAGLVLSGDTLYGTAPEGGSNGNGTVFAVNTGGTGFATLYNFSPIVTFYNNHGAYAGTGNEDGANPYGGLVLSGNMLYGTAANGGNNVEYGGNLGTVFALQTNGSGFTTLYSFSGGADCGNPYAGLVLSAGTLYGTTTGMSPAIADYGSVFRINTGGSGFQVLTTFLGNNGANPFGALVLSGSYLYGTTQRGGADGNGTVFRVTTGGTGFVIIHSFSALTDTTYGTNSDGAGPLGNLIVSGDTIYGTTEFGGSGDAGTVFEFNTGTLNLKTVYRFPALSTSLEPITTGTNSGGADPNGGLVLSANTLYGTAFAGGADMDGTVFALSLGPIPLNIQTAAGSVVLSWGNPSFSLQAAPAADGAYTNVPGAASPYTNTMTGSHAFFRLRSN